MSARGIKGMHAYCFPIDGVAIPGNTIALGGTEADMRKLKQHWLIIMRESLGQ